MAVFVNGVAVLHAQHLPEPPPADPGLFPSLQGCGHGTGACKKGLAKCFSGKALTHSPKPSLLPSPPKPSTEAAGKLGTQSTVRRQLVSVPWLVLGETEACRLEQLAGSWSPSCVTAALGQPLSQPLQNHGVALWDLLFLTISHRVAHACSHAEPHGYMSRATWSRAEITIPGCASSSRPLEHAWNPLGFALSAFPSPRSDVGLSSAVCCPSPATPTCRITARCYQQFGFRLSYLLSSLDWLLPFGDKSFFFLFHFILRESLLANSF